MVLCMLCVVCCVSAMAESEGVINHDQVRFRRKMESTDVWAMLDTGWKVQIISTQKYQGTAYYYVKASTPKNPDRSYWGYIDQRYVSVAAGVPAATAAPACEQPSAAAAVPVQDTAAVRNEPAVQTVPAVTEPVQAAKENASSIRFIVDEVNLRSAATTGSAAIGRFSLGQVVAYDGTVESNGRIWYHVNWNGKSGYVLGTCVETAGAAAAAPVQSELAAEPAAAPAATESASVSPAASTEEIQYIKTIKDKVWVRKAPSTQAHTVILAEIGSVFQRTDTVTGEGVQWYKILYGGETRYIMAKYCGMISESEFKASQAPETAAPAETAVSKDDAAAVSVPVQAKAGSIALTVMQNVIVRGSGSKRGEELRLLYSAGQVCTLTGQVNDADGYSWYQVNVKNITGWIRGDLLRILSEEEAAAYTNTPSAGQVLNKPELSDWYTGDVQKVFSKGSTAVVTDVKTGISFKVRRWSGGSHADVEPLTAADTAAMCRIYGVGTAQQISDKNLYQRRSILVTVGGHTYAASMYGIPHNYPEGDTIADNDFMGQFCIHFVNSTLHGGSSGTNTSVDADHQNAIQYAYQNGVTVLSGYGYSFQ